MLAQAANHQQNIAYGLKADDRTRVSYLEDAEIREATYKYLAAHKGASSVALTTRRKPRPIRAKNPKKSPSTP